MQLTLTPSTPHAHVLKESKMMLRRTPARAETKGSQIADFLNSTQFTDTMIPGTVGGLLSPGNLSPEADTGVMEHRGVRACKMRASL